MTMKGRSGMPMEDPSTYSTTSRSNITTQSEEVLPLSRPSTEVAQFRQDITNWVFLDNQMKMIHEKTKKIREKKQEITERICKYLAENNMESKRIKIQDGDVKGELRMYEKKEYSSLSFSYIEESLKKIIHNEEQIEYIIDFLRENRTITGVSDIRRS